MRLKSIEKYIEDNADLQNRYAYRIDSAKKRKGEAMGGEAAGHRELQKIMEADKKKASGRAKYWVEYHRILAQRKQLEQIRDDLRAEQQETEDEDKAAQHVWVCA